MYRTDQRIPQLLFGLSLVTLTACGKDGPTEPTEPPPPKPVPALIVVSPSSVMLDAIGQTVQLTAQVFDQHNAPMSSAVVTWTSGNDAVATVSAGGQVTAVGNGSASITARSGDASATVNVTIMQTAYGIVIEPQMTTLNCNGRDRAVDGGRIGPERTTSGRRGRLLEQQ